MALVYYCLTWGPGVSISRIVRQNACTLTPGRKFIIGFRNRPTPRRFIILGECPAPNHLGNSGRVGAMDYLSDNLEIETSGPLLSGIRNIMLHLMNVTN
jgi:hypothetical protein